MATSAAYNTFRRVFNDPSELSRVAARDSRASTYAHAWAYYKNHAFDPAGASWNDYFVTYGLYKYTRLIYNPVPPIIDFYVDHIYPGTIDESSVLEDGTQLVTSVFDATDERLKEAIAQLDQWSNWQSEQARMVRYAACTGNVLVEVVDETDRSKITTAIWWPSHVLELRLDNSGNVKSYTLEYSSVDEANEQYTYRKEVDTESFRYFKNDKPFDYSQTKDFAGYGAEVENAYGFVPAVWIKHTDDGGDTGSPAVWNVGKVDEINSLASHCHDHIHKAINAPKVFATDGKIISLTGSSSATTSDEFSTSDVRRDVMMLKAPAGTTVENLVGLLDLAAADPYIERALKSFERDYPELQAAEIIQNKAQISGAALERALAPSQAKLDRAAANYNQQIIKLKQMSVAIGGWRLQTGAWRIRSIQQERFRGFDLTSYAKGQLNFGLKRSLLVQATEDEQLEQKIKRANYVALVKDEVPADERRRLLGYTDEEIKEFRVEDERQANNSLAPEPQIMTVADVAIDKARSVG